VPQPKRKRFKMTGIADRSGGGEFRRIHVHLMSRRRMQSSVGQALSTTA